MEYDNESFSAGSKADSQQTQDAEDVAAKLLLSEVEAYLRSGQPRHAVAHIVEMTGVSRDQASEFVAELQSGLLG